MSLTKESKIRVLENFYALDYTLFGKSVTKMDTCCPEMVSEYTSIKGALLSVMIEMYKAVDHQPAALEEKVDSRALRQMARESAQIARENCQKLVSSSKGRADIKLELKQTIAEEEISDIEVLVKDKIREKAFSLAVDNLLVARTISESTDYKKLNDWEGKIIEDAYKILRDSLVECALAILDNDEIAKESE